MSEHATLVLVIVGLFAIESFAIVPGGATVFVAGFLKHFAARATSALQRMAKGRLLVFHPLVASSHHYIAGLPAIALDGWGIADCGPEDFDARARRPFVRWEQIGRIASEGSLIQADGLGTLDCGGARVARVWARVLNAIRSAPPARRAELARRWTKVRFSSEIVRRRVRRIDAACQSLEIFTDNAWFMILILCGALLWLGQPRLVLGLLGIGELSGWVTAFLFWRAHKRLHPRARRERIGKVIVQALCFPVALRARAALAREAVAFAHPAAVAIALLTPARGVDLLRQFALRWTHPLPEGGVRTDATRSTVMIESLKSIAKELDVKWSVLVAPPSASDATLKTYCPRCHAAYVLDSGMCADCPGIALAPFRGAERKT